MTLKRQTEILNFANRLRGAEAYFREDWGVYYFSLLGKCFGLMKDTQITLKGDLDENVRLRQNYPDITPGYYMNKRHWNTIPLSDTYDTSFYEAQVVNSYEAVYQKLSKRDKETVDEMPLRD